MKRQNRVVYYRDPLRDDFADTHIQTEPIPPEYPFVRTSPLYRIAAFLLYYPVAIPLVWLITKVYLGLRIRGRRHLRGLRGGVYLYGNHTQPLDAFLGPLVAFPRRAYVICNPDAVSIPGLRTVVQMLGGIPIPETRAAMPGFLQALRRRVEQGAAVTIFPEAHIWPFCTGIRPFPDVSFRYPAEEGRPAVAMVATYRRRRGLFFWCRRPGMTLTVSEPFYPDPALPRREARQKLRDQVYAFMRRYADAPDSVSYVRYVQIPAEEETAGGEVCRADGQGVPAVE